MFQWHVYVLLPKMKTRLAVEKHSQALTLQCHCSVLKILISPILVLVSRGPWTIFTSLTRSLGSDTDILPSNGESSKQNRGRATGGCNLITFRAPRIKGRFYYYVAKLHYILKCAPRALFSIEGHKEERYYSSAREMLTFLSSLMLCSKRNYVFSLLKYFR